jgi:restriction system protein
MSVSTVVRSALLLYSPRTFARKEHVGRRRDETFFDNMLDLLTVTPAWVGPVLAAALFVVVRFMLPPLFGPRDDGPDTGIVIRQVLPVVALFLGGLVMLAWLVAEFTKFLDRRRLDEQTGLDSIRELSWQEFERLVCEAYRRKGYLAETVGSASSDGGVDIRLTGHGETVLVQAKHWRVYRVGVRVVRELLGVVSSAHADRGIVVTSGGFTKDAQRFAMDSHKIELMDGQQLAALVSGVQSGAVSSPSRKPEPAPIASATSSPTCPSCGTTMVRRTARRGPQAGSAFWGCPKYPACRGTRAVAR